MASTIDTGIQTPTQQQTDEQAFGRFMQRIDSLIDGLAKPRLRPDDELDQLAERIAARLSPHALWDLPEVAKYLHRSEQHTRQWIVTLEGFPKPLRIPSGKVTGPCRARPMWRSKDVIGWAEDQVET
ncbi:helix-turn-helix transcriptional regulator [Paraburkholderia hospita]|uniref:helix-turn-helix transcriptional regulator n=1 Tax=Paraburkholderia hospita TaxID=169430 RepID=UPI003ED0545F